MNFSHFIVKVILHRLVAKYQKYFNRYFLDSLKVKIYKIKVMRIQNILVFEKWILKMITIDNIKKYKTLKNAIKLFSKWWLQFTCYISDILVNLILEWVKKSYKIFIISKLIQNKKKLGIIIKVNLHRILATYRKYFDRFFLDKLEFRKKSCKKTKDFHTWKMDTKNYKNL